MGQRGRCHTRRGAHGVSGLDTPELQETLFGIVWHCVARALEYTSIVEDTSSQSSTTERAFTFIRFLLFTYAISNG